MVPGSRRETEGRPEAASFPESVTHLQAVIQYLEGKLQDPSFDPRQATPTDFPNPYGFEGDIIDVFQKYVRVANAQTGALPPAEEVTKIQIEQQVLNKVEPLLARLKQRVEDLVEQASRSAFGFDTIEMNDAEFGLEIDNESAYEDEKLQFVRATYDILRTQYSPIEYRLPEWEKFRELPGNEALDLLTIAIMNKISAVYDDAASSGGTTEAIPGVSLDLWNYEELFKEITLHGTEDKSLKFFIEQFPWEVFLPEKQKPSEERIFQVRSEMSNLWKYRLICLGNMGNRAHDIEEMWRGSKAHGNFKDEILDYFGNLGDNGGYMQWDMPNYHKRHHTGILAEVFAGGREVADGEIIEEKSWLVGEYTNFFMHAIQQGNSNLSFAMPNTVSDLISSKQKYKKELQKRLKAKYGDEEGAERYKRDATKIDIAWNVAFWTIIHTLVIIDFDDDGLHTKLGRVVNLKQYAPKILAETANAKDRVRPTIAQQVETAMVTRDRFIHTVILLQDEKHNDIYQPHKLDFSIEDPKNKKLTPYEKYVKNLVRQSIGRYENIVRQDPSKSIQTLQAEATAIRKELSGLASFNPDNKTESEQKTEIQKLTDKISELNYRRGDSEADRKKKKQERADLFARRKALVQRFDLNKELRYLQGLIRALQDAQQHNRDLVYAAYEYAITERYDVIEVKPEHTNIGSEEIPAAAPGLDKVLTGLPLVIPKTLMYQDQRKENPQDENSPVVSDKNGRYDGRKFAVVPMQAIRDSMIDTRYVDFAAMTKKHNTNYMAAMADLRHWYDFGDLTKTDAIFRDIHSSDLTAKLMARVKLLHWPGKWKEFKFKAWSKLPWADIDKLAEKADKAFRSKVAVSKISIDEIAVGDGAKGADDTIRGIGFHKITQYAGRYAAGKMKASGASIPADRDEYERGQYSKNVDLPTIWLDVFRDEVEDFEGLLKEVADESESTAKKYLRREMATAVPENVRYATDEFFEGNDKRWEKQMIVEAFWVALGAYLDQYTYKPLKDEQGNDFNLAFMEVDTLMPHIKTQSGAKPMSFAHRELLLNFVDKQLAYFAGDNYANGFETPRDVGTMGDVIAMMKERGIIGSTQQFITDLHYLDHDFKNLKTVKKKD